MGDRGGKFVVIRDVYAELLYLGSSVEACG